MKVHDQIPFPIQGVSQQPAHVRADGRVEDQVNMLSDPVLGLVRRQGSEFIGLSGVPTLGLQSPLADLTAKYWRQVRARIGARDCTVWYATEPVAGAHAVLAYDHVSATWFAPHQLSVFPLPVQSSIWPHLTSTGVAALTVVDGTVFIAAQGRPAGAVSAVTTTSGEDYGVDIVAGLSGRTYTVTVYLDGATYSGSFTPKGLEYPTPIDLTHRSTADGGGPLSPTDSIYTQLVMAVQAEYDNAARAWKEQAINEARPTWIARELGLALSASGLPPSISVYNQANHFTGHGFAIHDHNGLIKDVQVSDGGDGEAVRCSAPVVRDAAKLPRVGTTGMRFVTVKAADKVDPVYYRAEPAQDFGGPLLQTITWVEAASGQDRHTTTLFSWKLDEGIIVPVRGGNTFSEGDVPTSPTYTVFSLSPRTAGDPDTAPTPDFLTRPINYLGTHQDRLLIGVGNRIFASRSGDYLNFYRSTVLAVNDDDPFTIAPELAQDDVIRDGLYNGRDLFLFGDMFQYVLSGRVTLTPHNAVLPKVGREDRTTQAHPALVGDKLYFARGTEVGEVLMLAPSDTVDASKAVSLTQHIESYITGAPRIIVGVHQPSMLAVLAASESTVYVYQMLDTADQGRLQTAWHRFTYDARLGSLFGLASEPHGLVLFFASAGAQSTIRVLRQPLRAVGAARNRVYLDGQRSPALGAFSEGEHWAAVTEHPQGYQGGALTAPHVYPAHIEATEASILYGFPFRAYVTPTQPIRRGADGVKLTSAPTTVASYTVSVSGSWQLLANGKMRWNGAPRTNDGRAVPADAQVVVPHGKPAQQLVTLEAGPYSPLRITALAWTGQVFWRTQR